MSSARILYLGIEKALKGESSMEEKRKKIEDLFVRSLITLPKGMGKDLYGYYLTRTGKTVENLRNLAYHLVDVVELFNEAYDTKKDPLDEGEWTVIRDLVNAYAADIEEDILTYVMALVVEKGYLG